jgi:hypothetical protein
MEKLTASNLVHFVNQLDSKATYQYINFKNKGAIQIERIEGREGPIRIKRSDLKKGNDFSKLNAETISTEMIWRVANAITPGRPFNIDRVLGGSYNTRSVLEALLAHTPQFYYAYPGRLETKGGQPSIKKGHKHLVWLPHLPHENGKMKEFKTDQVISEIPNHEAFYDALKIDVKPESTKLEIDLSRRHAQIQIALYFIGHQLNFRTWIARNDHAIVYNQKRILEYEGVIQSLSDEKLIASYDDAIQAAMLIDCIWFKNGRLMPAVMEVEHSTGVTSGLTRMKKFKDIFPPFPSRYVIVAPDELREKVMQEANHAHFRDLDTKFFPYSAVEELYALCQRRKIKGVSEEFLDCYMERMVE